MQIDNLGISPVVSSLVSSRAEWRSRLTSADLGLIFDCFSQGGDDEVDAAADVLTKISQFLEQGIVVEK